MVSKIKTLFIVKANEGYLSEQYLNDSKQVEIVFRADLKKVKVFEDIDEAERFIQKNNFEGCRVLTYGLVQ